MYDVCSSKDGSTEMHSEDVKISQVIDLRCIITGAVRQGTEVLECLICNMCRRTTRPTEGHESDHIAHHLCWNGFQCITQVISLVSIASLLSQTEHVCVSASTDHDTPTVLHHQPLMQGYTMQHSNGLKQVLPPPSKGFSSSTDI